MKDKNAEIENNDKSEDKDEADEQETLEPTRYGDWEKDGRCIDF
jgi:hypothetical protein